MYSSGSCESLQSFNKIFAKAKCNDHSLNTHILEVHTCVNLILVYLQFLMMNFRCNIHTADLFKNYTIYYLIFQRPLNDLELKTVSF